MMAKINAQKIEELLSGGVEEVIEKKHLEERLLSGEKLRIKYGVDPTKPDIHLGHTVPLRKLKEFQELGHTIVFIIGDFTAQIGDPSGRSRARIPLTAGQAAKNAATYLEQVKKIIDVKKAEIRKNSEWYSKKNLKDFIKLAGLFTVARLLERDDFTARMKKNADIHLHEVFYPILQAYDSIIVRSDLEVGGTDQKFNMLMGRVLQKKLNEPRQDVMTLPLLIGIDGKLKMSKSFDNYIGITEPPKEQYGKIMSIPDQLILDYFAPLTSVPREEIKNLPPRKAKARLAREIVKIYHGERAALAAEKEFDKVFKEGGVPSEIPAISVKEKSLNILDLLVKTKLAASKSAAKRLVEQGGVEIGGELKKDRREEIEIKKDQIIRVGKRKFAKIK